VQKSSRQISDTRTVAHTWVVPRYHQASLQFICGSLIERRALRSVKQRATKLKVHPLSLVVDNESSVVLISEHTTGRSERTKHMDVLYHFGDRYQRGDVSVQFVPTVDQYADMLTK
jgi:hypothetical protein